MTEHSASDRVEFVRALLAADPLLTRKDLVSRGEAFGMKVSPVDIFKARQALDVGRRKLQVAPEPAPAPAPEGLRSGPVEDSRDNRIDFVRAELRLNPDVTLDELRMKAAGRGLTIGPQTLGAARRSVGVQGGPQRRRSSPRSVLEAQGTNAHALLAFAQEYEALNAEAMKLRKVIAKIRTALGEV